MDREQLKIDLECVTGQRQLGDEETLVQVLKRIDLCAKSALMEERLAHYLSRRSYLKALAWLEDPTIPHRL